MTNLLISIAYFTLTIWTWYLLGIFLLGIVNKNMRKKLMILYDIVFLKQKEEEEETWE